MSLAALHAPAVASVAAAGPSIPAPSIEYLQLSPMLVVFGGAVVAVLVEAFAPRQVRRHVQLAISLLSLPGLSTFVSEFLVLVGTFSRYKVPAVFATAGIVLAAIYILWMYQRTMNGPTAPEVSKMPDLRPRELWAVAPLVALIIAMGVYPKPALDIINPAVKSTMSQVQVVDPTPAHPSTSLTTTAVQKGIQP